MLDAVVLGMGELGGVFARGFLKCGLRVTPVTRKLSAARVAESLPEPELVLVSVGEAALPEVLSALPASWKARSGLVQNELLPDDWRKQGVQSPTVCVVWFEKKPGMDVKVLLPSQVFGPASLRVADALGALAIPVQLLANETELLHALVAKNLYILTTNLGGLRHPGTVAELFAQHGEFARALAGELLTLQAALAGTQLPHVELLAQLEGAVRADPTHQSRGRSAPARLRRALGNVERLGLDLPLLEELGRDLAKATQ